MGTPAFRIGAKMKRSHQFVAVLATIAVVLGVIAILTSVWNRHSTPRSATSPPAANVPRSPSPERDAQQHHPVRTEAKATTSDAELQAVVRAALSDIGIDVESARIADGRAKGGERILIVGFTTKWPRQSKMLGELVKVLEAGYGLNRSFDGDIDSTIAIAGDADGKLVSCVMATTADAGRAARKQITAAQYLKTWTWGPGWKW